MNTKVYKLALAFTGLAMTGGAMAADGTGTASAKVISPISVAQDTGAGLEFGSLTTSASGQTVVISPAGVATGTAVRTTTSATRAAGAFTVTGEPAYTFALTMPTTGSVITGGGTAPETMALSAFTVAPVATYSALPGTAPTYTSTLDGTTGKYKFTVGATLTTVASQASGAYAGTYVVTVAYN